MITFIAFIVSYIVILAIVRWIAYKDGYHDGYQKCKDDIADTMQAYMQENYKLIREDETWKIVQK